MDQSELVQERTGAMLCMLDSSNSASRHRPKAHNTPQPAEPQNSLSLECEKLWRGLDQ